mgnify:CR=1 FL=1
MSQIEDIVKGHLNEMLNKENELSAGRLEICRHCPLGKQTSIGLVCDSSKWMNQKGEVINRPTPGYTRGCGCRMSAKSRLIKATCVVGKW